MVDRDSPETRARCCEILHRAIEAHPHSRARQHRRLRGARAGPNAGVLPGSRDQQRIFRPLSSSSSSSTSTSTSSGTRTSNTSAMSHARTSPAHGQRSRSPRGGIRGVRHIRAGA
eukprot:364997-Chlamydomonas_euryale.AAC.5